MLVNILPGISTLVFVFLRSSFNLLGCMDLNNRAPRLKYTNMGDSSGKMFNYGLDGEISQVSFSVAFHAEASDIWRLDVTLWHLLQLTCLCKNGLMNKKLKQEMCLFQSKNYKSFRRWTQGFWLMVSVPLVLLVCGNTFKSPIVRYRSYIQLFLYCWFPDKPC